MNRTNTAEALARNSTMHTVDLLGNQLSKKVEDMLDKIMRTSCAYVTIPSEFQVPLRSLVFLSASERVCCPQRHLWGGFG